MTVTCLLQVAQTCQLALQRIQFFSSTSNSGYDNKSVYLSVDPAPAFSPGPSVQQLERLLLNEDCPIFDRYRAMFSLRNIGGEAAVHALAASFESQSALLKHEVAYVLGQMQHRQAVPILRSVILGN